MKPSSITTNHRVTPIIQLISRGLRKAPLKKIRHMWKSTAARKIRAAQWWAWRMTSPKRTLNEMLMTDW